MTKVLVAYTTLWGITEEVAKAIGEELGKEDLQVEVRRLEEVGNLEAYHLVIRAQSGDSRNWTAIREWAGGLAAVFAAEKSQSEDGLSR